MNFPGTVAVMGGGSWATALAKLLLDNCETILWYMRRDDRIEYFKRHRRNPAYLSDVVFDIERIEFSSDINYVCSQADTLLLVMPSPYFKAHVDKIKVDISDKFVVSAVKGIVPDDNLIISTYMQKRFGVDVKRTLVVSGPCHAEEVALGRQSYLTIGCPDIFIAEKLPNCVSGKALKTITSTDGNGI
ncbi:MAG: NAD(P)-binding domain-containing protein, partial [Paramuribaculum sp.]|nr:NAD(P)-binding domain-containing protein [Paramuribaculum sp.]